MNTRLKGLGRGFYLTLIYLFLYLPILIVVLFSFNNARFSLLWHGFTGHWYQTLMHDADLIQVAVNSLFIGMSAATIATCLGALATISLFRYRFWGRKPMHAVLFVMIIIPDIVTGIALLLLYRFLHFSLGFWTLLLAHITFCLPFVFITANSRIDGIDKSIIEAARDLGAKEHTIFFRIMIPLLLPALISGWLLSFTLSLDDVIISYFVTGPSFEILPLKIFSMVKLGVSPEVNALSALLFFFTLLIVISTQLLMKKKT
ncbi:MAG: spermidine/putrescine ABC transporter permease PotC [Coxiella sp. RIFCSPHIGHO2_12_FULL_42_15]|nr:MAG: spermidine/putrescine ABC transporter permease PotC [Coxiella sp. RIFCSPHIGHO2_12_FULL_42_15]